VLYNQFAIGNNFNMTSSIKIPMAVNQLMKMRFGDLCLKYK